jgi:hypothetical protein
MENINPLSFLIERLNLATHDSLNPKLWDNEKLKPIVRHQLLKFAKIWIEFAEIPPKAVHGVVLTGGNSNYNYTDQSDLDVHVIVDKKRFPIQGKFLDDYLQDKKQLWSLEHDVRVFGYPVEPYAQGLDEGYHPGQGVYSLTADTWLQRPTHQDYDWADDPHLNAKVDYYIKAINDTIKKKDSLLFLGLKKRLKDMRKAGISRDGEFSFENLVFKALRNGGHLDRMKKAALKTTDADLSIKSSK